MGRRTETAWSKAAEAAIEPALRELACVPNAAAMRSYMRDQFTYLGATMPQVTTAARQVKKETDLTHGPATGDDLVAFAEAMWRHVEREHHYAGAKLLDAASRRKDLGGLGPHHLDRVRALLQTHSWWDTVDILAPNVVGALARAYPDEVLPVLDGWVVADDKWLIRTALLHQLKSKEATDPDRLARHCLAAAAHEDFFVRKAIGWALRSYSYVAPDWVETFVTDHEAALSPLSCREAMKVILRERS